MKKVFEEEAAARRAMSQFGGYLVLDALIGNTDRHHENWGVLRSSSNAHLPVVAPSFDHASSLGRELSDDGGAKSRERLLTADRMGEYARKARGGIYWSEQDAHGISPLDLVRRAAAACPELVKAGFEKLRDLEREVMEDIVDRIPSDWMTPIARRFALELMCYSLKEMRKLPQ